MISPKTVGTHIEHILRKTGARSRAQAVALAHGARSFDWHITIKGDGLMFATDASGNVAGPISCNVPPPPK